MHTIQIHWNGTDGADAVQAKLPSKVAANLLDRIVDGAPRQRSQ